MPISSDLIPIPSFVKNVPGRNSSATHELVFLATKLPPLGSKSYYIERIISDESKNATLKVKRALSEGDDKSIANEVLNLVEGLEKVK